MLKTSFTWRTSLLSHIKMKPSLLDEQLNISETDILFLSAILSCFPPHILLEKNTYRYMYRIQPVFAKNRTCRNSTYTSVQYSISITTDTNMCIIEFEFFLHCTELKFWLVWFLLLSATVCFQCKGNDAVCSCELTAGTLLPVSSDKGFHGSSHHVSQRKSGLFLSWESVSR